MINAFFVLSFSVKTVVTKEKAVSVLYIAHAKKNDSGEYVCSIGNLTQNTIYVHVINGKFKSGPANSNDQTSDFPSWIKAQAEQVG